MKEDAEITRSGRCIDPASILQSINSAVGVTPSVVTYEDCPASANPAPLLLLDFGGSFLPLLSALRVTPYSGLRCCHCGHRCGGECQRHNWGNPECEQECWFVAEERQVYIPHVGHVRTPSDTRSSHMPSSHFLVLQWRHCRWGRSCADCYRCHRVLFEVPQACSQWSNLACCLGLT